MGSVDEEMLIEYVRPFDFLYDSTHPKYMDSARKELAWKEIANKLKQPASVCKRKWQCLRDALRRALNKKKSMAGQSAKKIKKWRYEAEMSFLIPFLSSRKSVNSDEISSDEEVCDVSGMLCEVLDNADSVDVKSETALDSDTPCSRTTLIEIDGTAQSNATTSDSLTSLNSARRTVMKQEEKPNPSILKHLIYENEMPVQKFDELDRFFLNLSETVKRFTPYQQVIAKKQIFSLVSDMELNQLKSDACVHPSGDNSVDTAN